MSAFEGEETIVGVTGANAPVEEEKKDEVIDVPVEEEKKNEVIDAPVEEEKKDEVIDATGASKQILIGDAEIVKDASTIKLGDGKEYYIVIGEDAYKYNHSATGDDKKGERVTDETLRLKLIDTVNAAPKEQGGGRRRSRRNRRQNGKRQSKKRQQNRQSKKQKQNGGKKRRNSKRNQKK